MTVKQISVFLENTPGRLAELTDILMEHSIDMQALSVAETPDFGILRLIVDDSGKTADVLKAAGYVLSITPVIAVAVPDEKGSLNNILNLMGKSNINIEYTYAFKARRQNTAYMIFRVKDNDEAVRILSANGVALVDEDTLRSL